MKEEVGEFITVTQCGKTGPVIAGLQDGRGQELRDLAALKLERQTMDSPLEPP